MAEIAPFRGILYARPEVSSVIAPPYDVITEEDRVRLEELDAHNCVRLILPRGEGEAKYQQAAETLRGWLGKATLVRDKRPALYRYHQIFTSAELASDKMGEVVRR